MKRIILVLLMFISIASFGQSTFIREGSTSGTNTYTATVTSFTSYTSAALILKFNNGNTSTATINVNSIGAVNIRKWDGDSWEPLASGDIPADSDVLLVHDNTNSYFKAYVLPEIGQGSTYTAGSGLTLTADQFKLGGTITENTTFSNSGFNVTHASSGTRMGAFRIWATTIGLDGSTSAFIQSGDNTVTTSAASGVDIVGDSVRLATNGSQIRLNTDGSLSIDGDVGTSGQVITSNGAGPLTWETPSGGVSDGDKGDITVSSSGTVWNIDAGVVGPTELASLSSSDLAGKLTDEVGTGSAVFSEPDVNVQTGSYTLVLTDKAKEVRMNVAGSNNLTVPLNSSVAFPIGTLINISQYGAGTTTVVATGGVTINSSAGNLLSPGQFSPMILRKIGTDEWYLWNGSTAVTASFTRTNGTYITTTLSGSMSGALNTAVDITVDLTGVVPLTLGGTGASSATQTYTPTFTNTTNVAASTPRACQYMRVGNTITVSGQFDIDPTSAGQIVMGISLPVASAFTTAFQAGGTAAPTTVADAPAAIISDATNDRATLTYVCVDTTNHTMAFTFTYQVL